MDDPDIKWSTKTVTNEDGSQDVIDINNITHTVEELHINENGNLEHSTTTVTNDDGSKDVTTIEENETRQEHFDTDGSLIHSESVYDYSDGTHDTVITEYHDNVTEKQSFDTDNKLEWIEKTITKDDGAKIEIYTDVNDNIVEVSNYDKDGNLERKEVYHYSDNENGTEWVERRELNDKSEVDNKEIQYDGSNKDIEQEPAIEIKVTSHEDGSRTIEIKSVEDDKVDTYHIDENGGLGSVEYAVPDDFLNDSTDKDSSDGYPAFEVYDTIVDESSPTESDIVNTLEKYGNEYKDEIDEKVQELYEKEQADTEIPENKDVDNDYNNDIDGGKED